MSEKQTAPAAGADDRRVLDHRTGLPRMVLEARSRLGPAATPEQVAGELQEKGISDATPQAVRDVWDESDRQGDSGADGPGTPARN